MTEPACDRRLFLAGLAAVPFSAAAPGEQEEKPKPAATAAAPPKGPEPAEIGEGTVAEAGKLLGLSFTTEERTRIAAAAKDHLESFTGLRAEPIANDLGPAFVYFPSADRPPAAEGACRALAEGDVALPDDPADVAFLPVSVLARLLRDRRITSVALTQLCLERLKTYDPELLCVVTLTESLALEQARQADEEIAAGRWRGPLHGVPYGLKDLFAVRGFPTTWGARPLRDQVIDEDAAVYERLRAAGAVLAAKLSLGALAMGDLWFKGRTRNPWNREQGSSGSSAGSAAAVAAGLLPFAVGTETLGSIISPCTRCGATGLRPTFGRISRHGAMVLCWTMDKVGPIARTARDTALVFDVLRGADPRDPSTVAAPFDFDPRRPLDGYRIGFVAKDFDGDRAEPDRAVLGVLKQLGATPKPVSLPEFRAGPLRIILDAEAAAAFDDFTRDGRVRELDGQGPQDWPDQFRAARFLPAVEYLQAMRRRTQLVAAWEALMRGLDALITPTFRGGTLLPTNLTGHPACVLPSGAGRSGPLSMTFVGGLYREGPLLEVASRYQEATAWHTRRPPLD